MPPSISPSAGCLFILILRLIHTIRYGRHHLTVIQAEQQHTNNHTYGPPSWPVQSMCCARSGIVSGTAADASTGYVSPLRHHHRLLLLLRLSSPFPSPAHSRRGASHRRQDLRQRSLVQLPKASRFGFAPLHASLAPLDTRTLLTAT